MGRLTKRNKQGTAVFNTSEVLNHPIDKVLDKLAHYEDLEEQGRFVEVIRCKECAMESTCVHAQYQGEDGYCSKAELKELEGE